LTFISRYVLGRRVANAAFDIVHSDQTILEIATKYAFANPDSFTRAFRRNTGINPNEFRARKISVGRKTLCAGVFGVSLKPVQSNSLVLSFIEHIKEADFTKEADVKLLYDKAREIESSLAHASYEGNVASINRLWEVTEKLDRKIPDMMVVRIPKFRALTTGLVGWDKIFDMGSDAKATELSARGLTAPILFDGGDFLYGKDGKAAWIWRITDEATEADTAPFEITEFEGGLYVISVSIDGDGESHDKVRAKVKRWLETTNFVLDDERAMMGHMIFTHDDNPDILKGLGYEQMVLYAPIKLK